MVREVDEEPEEPADNFVKVVVEPEDLTMPPTKDTPAPEPEMV
jgi:hypothetical protein